LEDLPKLTLVPIESSTTRSIHPAASRALSQADYQHFLPMVRRIALGRARRLPRTILVDDLMSAGWVGVAEAFTRAPTTMPVDELDAFISCRVVGAMIDHARSSSPKSRMERNASRRISRTIDRLTKTQERAPREDEVAAALDVSVDEYRGMLARDGGITALRCDTMDIDDVEVSAETIGADDATERRMLVDRMSEAILALPDRTQKVLMLYYQESCTLKEIGAVLGLTESRVSQLHSEAMKTLRASMSDA
jgi:RNA polymerase sigma factor for flagellar operon FliA